MILALTSNTVPPSALYDAADTVIAQRLSQIEGVAEVTVNGAEQPAIRVRVNPVALASMGLVAWRTCAPPSPTPMRSARSACSTATSAPSPSAPTTQLRTVPEYDPIVVRNANGTVVRLSAVASIEAGRAQQPLRRLVQRPALGAAGDQQAGQLPT